MQAKVTVTGHIPERHLREWLQHLRDFDASHQGCHLSVEVATEMMGTKEINEALDQITPPFAIRRTIPS